MVNFRTDANVYENFKLFRTGLKISLWKDFWDNDGVYFPRRSGSDRRPANLITPRPPQHLPPNRRCRFPKSPSSLHHSYFRSTPNAILVHQNLTLSWHQDCYFLPGKFLQKTSASRNPCHLLPLLLLHRCSSCFHRRYMSHSHPDRRDICSRCTVPRAA